MFKFGWIPAHPTLYLKKDVYNKIGLFNLKYKVVSDYDFMIRLGLNKNIKLFYIKDYLIHMRYGGASNNGLKGYLYNLKESYQILKDNKIKCALIVSLFRIIGTIFQMITAKFVLKKGK
jgi:glycosyltransferase